MKRWIFVLLLGISLTSPIYAQEVRNYLPIYRLYNTVTSEHFYTPDRYEETVLQSQPDWRFEGLGWFYSGELEGDSVYRLYNPGLNDHLYTTNVQEKDNLVSKHGWRADFGGKRLFKSNGTIAIYRLYQPRTGRHLLTTSVHEYNVLAGAGWRQEGIALYGTAEGEPW